MPQLKAVLLDFDGVLVESNGVKDKAFAHIFSQYPQFLPEILAYHRVSDVIRFEKFKYIYSTILKLPYSKAIEDALGKAFAEYCIKEVVVAPQVKGAHDLLAYFYERLPIYLVSINPPDDLHIILKERGIHHYFKGIYSVVGEKSSAIKDILAKEHIQPQETVFIGDSKGDLVSAKDVGVPFIGRLDRYPFDKDIIAFKDLGEILTYLKKML